MSNSRDFSRGVEFQLTKKFAGQLVGTLATVLETAGKEKNTVKVRIGAKIYEVPKKFLQKCGVINEISNSIFGSVVPVTTGFSSTGSVMSQAKIGE